MVFKTSFFNEFKVKLLENVINACPKLLHMGIFRKKQKEEPKKEEGKYQKTRGKCPICGNECDVNDYGLFLGYFCMKCGPTTEVRVKDK